MVRLLLLGALLLAVPCCAQTLKITGGLVDGQVVQRDAAGSADLRLSGTADNAEGRAIEARVARRQIVVEGFDWRAAANIHHGKWSMVIEKVPTGGPYRVELRPQGAAGTAAVSNVLVGDLWILAGQSNMEGFAYLDGAEQPHELVHSFDLADRWLLAKEPLHTLFNAADRVHWPLNDKKKPERYEGERLRKALAARNRGAGLGLPFAVEMVRRTGVPVGLIPCAHPGTTMRQWAPALKRKGRNSLYGSMVRRFRAAGGKVKGVLWYQGESDADNKAAPRFQPRFEKFVRAVREDFRQPDLPFYYVQIGRWVSEYTEEWNMVQEMQRKAESTIPRAAMAAAVDLPLDDAIHLSTQGLKQLGRRLANLACHDLFPEVAACAALRRGPRPVSASFGKADGLLGVVRLALSDVNGTLQSEEPIAGFTIHSADGRPLPPIAKAQFDSSGSAVLLFTSGELPKGAVLRYGYGKHPDCNVRDQAGMALPVFGPLQIQ